MKKIFSFYRKVAGWLASFGSDKYLHIIFGLLIAYITAVISHAITGECSLSAGGLGMLVTIVVGFVKETVDSAETDNWDFYDFLATLIGGVIGFGLWMI